MANTLQNRTRVVTYCDATVRYYVEHKGSEGNYIPYYDPTDTNRLSPLYYASQASADTFLGTAETTFQTQSIDSETYVERAVVSCP